MEIQDIKLIHNWCVVLCYIEKDNRYGVLIGKTGKLKFDISEVNDDIYYNEYLVSSLVAQLDAKIEIPFVRNKNCLFNMVILHGKEEYETIVSVLEAML